MRTKILRPRMVLIGLCLPSVLLLGGDASRAQETSVSIKVGAPPRATIAEKVLGPLKAQQDFRFAFSRARVVAPTYAAQLLADAPRKDRFGARFVAFEILEKRARPLPQVAKAKGKTPPVLTGCVYPKTGEVYVLDAARKSHVPAAQHPMLMGPKDRKALLADSTLREAPKGGTVEDRWKGLCEAGSVS